jgi:acetyl-CoA acetyltransferase family protein
MDKTEVVFLSGVRTPFGTFGGALRDISAVELTTIAARAALGRASIDASQVSHAVFGNVLLTTADSIYFTRHVALAAGCPIETPALTVNRLCGSGFQAIVSGAEEILLGYADICLVGGGESMSQAPHVARGLRWGTRLGQSPVLTDSLWEGLTDTQAGCSMGDTAENLAQQCGVDRMAADAFALRSQTLARDAWAAGAFSDEIVPVPVTDPKTRRPAEFTRDEHPRPDTTAGVLANLKPVFRPNGVVTAGNASGIGDGAAALVLANAAYAKAHGNKPLARLVSWGIAGVDPRVMGIGPVPAARQALDRAGLSLADMDLVEVNEAFAPQTVAVERTLGIDRDRLNVHGGAIALSHPLAASGARITTHLIHALRRGGKRYGLGSACIGGGQGIAVIVEAIAG